MNMNMNNMQMNLNMNMNMNMNKIVRDGNDSNSSSEVDDILRMENFKF